MKRAVALLAGLALAGCSDPDGARHTLEQAGLTDIQTGSYAAWSCGNDDTFATSFTATNVRGQRVSGAVCSALTKGGTIRYD